MLVDDWWRGCWWMIGGEDGGRCFPERMVEDDWWRGWWRMIGGEDVGG